MSKVYPPDHPLRSAQLKLKRANIHIRALNLAMRAVSRNPEFTLRRQGRLDVPRHKDSTGVISEPAGIWAARIDPRIGVGWGLIVGDILSNLRASLDHVAWALAGEFVRQRGAPLTTKQERRIYFPLRMIADKTPVIGGLENSAVCFFPPTSWATVEQFQPYNRTHWPELQLLGVIAELTDEDKHRVVTTVRRDVMFRLLREQEFIRTNLHQPNEIMFFVTESAAHHLEPAATFQVVLNVPCYAPSYFAPADEFRLVHHFIRDEVIPAFAGFFP